MAASSSPRLLAGEALHREALRSAESYPAERWAPPPPRGDYPHAAPPAAGAAFSRQDVEHFVREGVRAPSPPPFARRAKG
jgi:hypothetical protein